MSGFDSKCYDLAEHFLENDAPEDMKNELAQLIQNAVYFFMRAQEGAIDPTTGQPT